jgi:hypothetical protein
MALSAKPMGSTTKGSKSEGYDTNYDTNRAAIDVPAPEVIENMVGTRRLELLTSTVSKRRFEVTNWSLTALTARLKYVKAF